MKRITVLAAAVAALIGFAVAVPATDSGPGPCCALSGRNAV
ncbi:hypothetical protein ACFPFX_03315 [Streptomyces mauvecolor]|uniref:Uncharacterized protein n=1 Tax=Streptomyces mauvecolor TaxID=58345 RepID=A0ABV9UIQ7_9ACTN